MNPTAELTDGTCIAASPRDVVPAVAEGKVVVATAHAQVHLLRQRHNANS
jgi:hypothetical protein